MYKKWKGGHNWRSWYYVKERRHGLPLQKLFQDLSQKWQQTSNSRPRLQLRLDPEFYRHVLRYPQIITMTITMIVSILFNLCYNENIHARHLLPTRHTAPNTYSHYFRVSISSFPSYQTMVFNILSCCHTPYITAFTIICFNSNQFFIFFIYSQNVYFISILAPMTA
jgi:hypothetical protein